MSLLRLSWCSDVKGQGFPRLISRLELQCWCPTTATSLWDYHCWKEPSFFIVCKAVKTHTCTNTYPGRGWGEMLTLTFLQTCAERRCWLSLCCLPWGTATKPAAPAAQGVPAPLGQVQARKLQRWWRKRRRIASALFLLFALAPWNTPKWDCLVRSGLNASRPGATCAEARHQHIGRYLLHPSLRETGINVGESLFSLSAKIPLLN